MNTPATLHTLAQWAVNAPPVRIAAVSVVLRVVFLAVYALAMNSWELVPLAGETRPWAGTDGYAQLARTMWETGEYAYEPGAPPCHNRPPVTAGLLYVFGAWWSAGWWSVWWVFTVAAQAVLIIILTQATRWLGWGPRTRAVLGWALALHPLWLMAARASTFVVPAALLLGLCVWVWAHPRLWPVPRAALLGGLGGLLALTHGTLMLVPGVLAVGCLWGGWRRLLPSLEGPGVGVARNPLPPLQGGESTSYAPLKKRVWLALICLLAAAAVVAPWTVRNRLALGEWLPVATGGGIQYWKGEGVYTNAFNIEYGVYQQVTGKSLTLMHFGPLLPAHDRLFADTALKHIALRPAHFAGRTVAGLFVFWAPDDQGIFKQIFTGLCNLPLVGLFLWGLWRHRHRVPVWVWGVAAIVFGLNFEFALFYGNASYFLTVLPLLVVGAVWGWKREDSATTLTNRCRSRK